MHGEESKQNFLLKSGVCITETKLEIFPHQKLTEIIIINLLNWLLNLDSPYWADGNLTGKLAIIWILRLFSLMKEITSFWIESLLNMLCPRFWQKSTQFEWFYLKDQKMSNYLLAKNKLITNKLFKVQVSVILILKEDLLSQLITSKVHLKIKP